MEQSLLTQGIGPRTLASLAPASAAALVCASRALYSELGDACASLCLPAAALRRSADCADVLRRALVCRTWTQPRRSKELLQIIATLERDGPGCSILESANRASLSRGIAPRLSRGARNSSLPDAMAAQALGKLLQDKCCDIRRSAACGLGRLGALAAEHVGALGQLLSQGEPEEVRLAAVEALGLLGPVAQTQSEAVARALRDPNPHVCARALEALRRLGVASAPYSAALLGDGDRYVRTRAAAALGRLGAGAIDHVGAVAALLADANEHQDVRGAALQALTRIVGEDAPLAIAGAFDAARCLKREAEEPAGSKKAMRLWPGR